MNIWRFPNNIVTPVTIQVITVLKPMVPLEVRRKCVQCVF